MTSDAVSRLLDQAANDSALADALAAAPTVADAVRVAADHGIAVTPDELRQLEAPLSDTDLAGVTGGYVDQIFPTVPWLAC